MARIFTPSRIQAGSLGYQIAADAIAQRGINLDIARISVARALDMLLESTYGDEIENLVEFEAEISDLIDRMMGWIEDERKFEATAALEEIQGRYLPSESQRRARYYLYEAVRQADRKYGRENVEAFIRAYHSEKAALLSIVKAR